MKNLIISVIGMFVVISLLVFLYRLDVKDQPWVIFGAMAGVAMSLRKNIIEKINNQGER